MRDIPGYEERYSITSDGKVWSKINKKWLKPYIMNTGYIRYCFYQGSSETSRHVFAHRLVLETYVEKSYKNALACHRNDIRTDNRVENLYWGDKSSNSIDITKNGNRNFSEEEIRIFKLLKSRGFKRRELMKIFKMTQHTAKAIIANRIYSWVKPSG